MLPPRLTVVQIGTLGDDGDGMYRLQQPAEALAALDGIEVYNVHYLSRWRDEAALAADVLVVYFTIDIELFRVLAQRRQLGRPSLCEINDYFVDVQPWNPVHTSWSLPRRQQYLFNLMTRSDAVQVSSAPLAAHFASHNPAMHVLANHVAQMPPPRPPATGDAGVTVGWGGSAGHLRDVEHIAPRLVEWLRRQPAARLAIMGDPAYAALFTAAPPERFHFVRGGSLDAYLAFVRTLDVGLAPLLPTEYNRCRSDVKFLEYAAHGAVAVLPRREPYAASVRDGETGILVDDETELIAALDRLVAEPALRRRLAAAAHDYVGRERQLAQHIGGRHVLYADCLRRAQPSGDPVSPALRRLADAPLGALPGLERRGPRWWQLLPHSAAEQRFLAGLDAMEQDPAAAGAAFGDALRLAPDYYQACYFAGRCLARQGRAAEAEQAYQAAARLNPFYSRPLSALADLHGTLSADYRHRSAALNPPLE